MTLSVTSGLFLLVLAQVLPVHGKRLAGQLLTLHLGCLLLSSLLAQADQFKAILLFGVAHLWLALNVYSRMIKGYEERIISNEG